MYIFFVSFLILICIQAGWKKQGWQTCLSEGKKRIRSWYLWDNAANQHLISPGTWISLLNESNLICSTHSIPYLLFNDKWMVCHIIRAIVLQKDVSEHMGARTCYLQVLKAIVPLGTRSYPPELPYNPRKRCGCFKYLQANATSVLLNLLQHLS